MRLVRKNKKHRDCVVVATYNIAAWCNARRPYKEVEKIAKSCGYNDKKGVYYFQFDNIIKKMNLPVKRVRPKSFNEIESKLRRGKFFVFFYTPTGDASGHAMSAFVDDQGIVRLINPESQRVNWFQFGWDITLNGVRNFRVYEVPARTKFL